MRGIPRTTAWMAAVLMLGGCANFKQTGQPERVWPYPEPPVVEPAQRDGADDRARRQRPPADDRYADDPYADRREAANRPGEDTDPAVTGGDGGFGVAGQPTPVPSFDGPRSLQDTAGPAAMQLAQQAAQQRQQGDLPGAAAQLERALRIEPRNPFLWLLLANVHLEQSDTDQARQMARRARSLAPDNPYVAAPAWRIAESAWQIEGDTRQAEAAARRAEQAELRQS